MSSGRRGLLRKLAIITVLLPSGACLKCPAISLQCFTLCVPSMPFQRTVSEAPTSWSSPGHRRRLPAETPGQPACPVQVHPGGAYLAGSSLRQPRLQSRPPTIRIAVPHHHFSRMNDISILASCRNLAGSSHAIRVSKLVGAIDISAGSNGTGQWKDIQVIGG